MPRPRRPRDIPLSFDDGFRGAVAMLVSVPFVVAAFVAFDGSQEALGAALPWLCVSFTTFFVVHIAWTHVLHVRTDAREVERLAALQHRRGASTLSKALGLSSAEEWGVTAAATALVVSIAAAVVVGRDGGLLLPVLVLLTAA